MYISIDKFFVVKKKQTILLKYIIIIILCVRIYSVNNIKIIIEIKKVNKKEVKEVFKKHDNDTGSAEFQISQLTNRIDVLTDHLRSNPGDNSSKHGMLKLVGKRSRLLNYLSKDNLSVYENILTSLGIRK